MFLTLMRITNRGFMALSFAVGQVSEEPVTDYLEKACFEPCISLGIFTCCLCYRCKLMGKEVFENFPGHTVRKRLS